MHIRTAQAATRQRMVASHRTAIPSRGEKGRASNLVPTSPYARGFTGTSASRGACVAAFAQGLKSAAYNYADSAVKRLPQGGELKTPHRLVPALRQCDHPADGCPFAHGPRNRPASPASTAVHFSTFSSVTRKHGEILPGAKMRAKSQVRPSVFGNGRTLNGGAADCDTGRARNVLEDAGSFTFEPVKQ